jgi:osmoprotectant transport system permease protein
VNPRRGVPRCNPVLLLLVAAAVPAVLAMAFVRVAPNRLLSGEALTLFDLAADARHLLWLPAAVLVGAVFRPAARAVHVAVALAATLLLALLFWLAGSEAARAATGGPSLVRVSLGGGFWVLALLAWLAAADALQRLRLAPAGRTLALAAVLAPLAVLLAAGSLDALSLLKEYDNRREAFDAALLRHLQIVGAALGPALAIGVPLGVVAARRAAVARPLFAGLNIIQTVPSIALFALLIAPLAALGLKGIGLLPAAIALTLYALLPVVHGTASGLQQVSPAALDAGRGMGMTERQLFWRVSVPLALPVLLSGLRVTAVQLIGLAVVAALIGAGGFGALVFQGLASSALDLVMLGVIPVVALAVAVDAAFGLLAATAPFGRRYRSPALRYLRANGADGGAP